ncbi:endonuclease/exonuclease/phosphatase family protein [Delftia acidovorans]|uniref:endonuclease/exonuclease/phosphatase family protein n=1 Tax=Delftia acidovorans TaxID=80866 RepID=UPI0018D61060|nr:endonuclease/exonuclease/phosphatase family protein [Delftia acidovorans]QPR35087.1 endonuclease/exonuclease/phosphatase family protein [Delftia acidovorans]
MMQILTWNTQWCLGLDGRMDPQRIVAHALSMADIDVLCLQEIAIHYPGLQGAPGDQVEQIRQALPEGWKVFFGAAVDEFTAVGRQRFGNLVATRLPVLQLAHHRLPYPHDGGVRSMPRCCTAATVMDAALGPVRVMSTHLEYFSRRQRMAQALALRSLQIEALGQAEAPPQPASDGSPQQTKPHTPHAVLCGDFNFEPHEDEYAGLSAPWAAGEEGALSAGQWHNSWSVLHPDQPQPPTFRLFDRQWGPEPGACDFAWVSDSLRGHVRGWAVDSDTRLSDHQPVLLQLD